MEEDITAGIDYVYLIPEEKMIEFKEELRKAVNKCSVEQYCNTPDFILAQMLAGFFEMYCLTRTMVDDYNTEEN